MTNITTYCTITLIRHGQTDWNKEGRFQGHTDIPLNDLGIQQALELGQKFKDHSFSAAYSSDLSRALNTAQLVLATHALEIVTNSNLREKYMGSLEGVSFDEMDFFFKAERYDSQENIVSCKWQSDVESYAEVYNRVMNTILQVANSHMGTSVLVATHGGVLTAIMYHLNFIHGHKWTASNCAFLTLRVNAEGDVELVSHEGIHAVQLSLV